MEWFAYGNAPVKRHGDEQHNLSPSEEVQKEDLRNAALKGDRLVLSKMSMITFGVAKEDRHMSMRDRLLSRKYMGE